MTRNPSPSPDLATPRPWYAHFNAHGDPSIVTDHARPGFTQIAELSTMPDDYGRANALLIAEAVNNYDRLRAVEADRDRMLVAVKAAILNIQHNRIGPAIDGLRVARDLSAAIQGGSKT